MRWIYWTGLLCYSAVVIYVGWRGYRRSMADSGDDLAFWAAGKSLNSWSAGLSISASFMSISWSCVYAVQLVYWYGVSSLWLLAIPWLTVMVFFYLLTPHFRKLPAFSQPEMLAQRFGESARAYLALPLAFVFLVWGGAEIYAAAQVLAPILDVPFVFILTFIALVVAAYSFLGGFSAVVTTDKVQFTLVAFFIISLAYVSVATLLGAGDLSAIIHRLPSPPKSAGSATALLAISPALVILTMVAYLPGWIVETDIWLRLQAASSNTHARRAVLIASVNSAIFIALLPVIIGLAALYLYPPVGGEIPEKLNDGAAIFSLLLTEHTPFFLSILLVVGLASASMSTIDTCSNVMALSLSYDLIEPRFGANWDNRKRRNFSRVMSALAVFMAYVYALFTESLWDIFYLSSGVLTTTLFIPMVALFRKGAKARQVKAAAAAGFISTFVFYFLEKNGKLSTIQPDWLSETGLGYIIWGLLFSGLGYFGLAGRQFLIACLNSGMYINMTKFLR